MAKLNGRMLAQMCGYGQLYDAAVQNEQDGKVNKIIDEAIIHLVNNIVCEGKKKSNVKINQIGDIPNYYAYNYMPIDDEECYDEKVDKIRNLIWCFKNDSDDYSEKEYKLAFDKVLKLFTTIIKNNIDGYKNCVIVPVPCSSKENHQKRWKQFMDELSNNLNIENGYQHIKIYKDAAVPSHYCGKRTLSDYDIDEAWFEGKDVIIIDDLVTEGYHISDLADRLRSVRANVIASVTIAKTKE